MKVKELIEKLSHLPQDYEVYFSDGLFGNFYGSEGMEIIISDFYKNGVEFLPVRLEDEEESD